MPRPCKHLPNRQLPLRDCGQLNDLHCLHIRLAGCRESRDHCIDHRLKSRLQIQTSRDGLLHMSRMDEDRNRVAHHTGSHVEVGDTELAPRYPVLQYLPHEPGHPSRIVADEVRALCHDPAVETVDLRIVTQLGPLAAVERQDKAAKPLCRRTIGHCKAGRQIGLLGHRPRRKGVEDLRFRPEVPIERRMRQAHGLGDVDDVCLGLAEPADLFGGGVQNAIAMIVGVVRHAQLLADTSQAHNM